MWVKNLSSKKLGEKAKNLLKIFSIFIFLFFPHPVKATPPPKTWQITVSAALGEPKLSLFGYTSPQTQVELKGMRITEFTTADSNGYFYFDRVFLPPASPNYPELCLTAIDPIQSAASFPTCLPPLPYKKEDIKIGPVLLAPIILLEKEKFLPHQQTKAYGFTFPQSKVIIFLANNNYPSPPAKLISFLLPSALAFSLPQYEIKSNSQGYFEFNLPSNKPSRWRIFATAYHHESPSPKSNTLNFWVLNQLQNLWLIIKEFLKTLWIWIAPWRWWLLIGGEIIILLWLMYHHHLKKSKKNNNNLFKNIKI